MAVLKEIAGELRKDLAFNTDILEPLNMRGTVQFEESAIINKCRIKTNLMQHRRVGREMNRRIKIALMRKVSRFRSLIERFIGEIWHKQLLRRPETEPEREFAAVTSFRATMVGW